VVVRRGGETFLATPKLQPTDMGMVRNPFIQKYPFEDLYISPGDYNPGQPAGTLLELVKGASQDAEGYTFKFIDYARSGHDTQQGAAVTVGAIVEVSRGGVTTVITPTVTADGQKGLVSAPVLLPGTTIEVALDTPQVGQAIISVLDTAKSGQVMPAFITLEVSREPGINLLWAGLMIIFTGTVVAVVRRRIEGQRLLAAEAPEADVVPLKQAKRAKKIARRADPQRGSTQPSRATKQR
jgi:hypothetical protein